MMVGDGSSDLATQSVVDLFIGYGGVIARDKVKAESDVFVQNLSLAVILPLATGRLGWEKAQNTEHEAIFRKGIELALDNQNVLFQNDEQHQSFIILFSSYFTSKLFQLLKSNRKSYWRCFRNINSVSALLWYNGNNEKFRIGYRYFVFLC